MAVTPTRTAGQAPGGSRARRPTWLLAGLRVLWGAALVLAIVLLLFSTPLRVDLLLQQCSGPNCESGQLTPQGTLTLQGAGIPPGLYVGFSVALYIFAALVYIGAAPSQRGGDSVLPRSDACLLECPLQINWQKSDTIAPVLRMERSWLEE